MISNKKRIEVSLMGHHFTLRSEQDEKYIQNLATFVTSQIEDIRHHTRTVSSHHLALLVALNLADKLFSIQKKLDSLKNGLKEKANLALNNIDEALLKIPNEYKIEPEKASAQDKESGTVG
ncbi:cell division protein ZapA [Sulfobacillus acidophilus]|uniref:Cell division protein ZapA n=1 Tax=Sulfobacillus acidophilus TaxID=53633 RepID=A0ABS3AW27_9FIRM|nr:cell division protein ZapA [Sulfobacillus acidophilus]